MCGCRQFTVRRSWFLKLVITTKRQRIMVLLPGTLPYRLLLSVTKLYLTLCDPMDCSMPASLSFTISQSFLNSRPLRRWCHPTMSSTVTPFSSCPLFFPAWVSFPISRLFTSGGQSIEATASVLPLHFQGWFPLGLTGLISLLSKGLSRVSSSTMVWKHQFFGVQPFFFFLIDMDQP